VALLFLSVLGMGVGLGHIGGGSNTFCMMVWYWELSEIIRVYAD